MASVQVIEKNMPGKCPVSNLYKVDDGTYLVVTVLNPYALRGIFAEMNGTTQLSHIQPSVEVFLCDERGMFIDADGNIENGLNALASTDPNSVAVHLLPSDVQTHEDALLELGYEIE
ncbi:hypothetical protein SEA_KEELAN_54 [Gordonia phage Keelan]|nr:hypothetical protein SEA_KEELAN_54 [Gordonia phage Keelan]